eukprot:COSAG04_NODE_3311_length_2947_cov_202.139045_1_plen_187_part_00
MSNTDGTQGRLAALLSQHAKIKTEGASGGGADSLELQIQAKDAEIQKLKAIVSERGDVIVVQGGKADQMAKELKAKDEKIQKMAAELKDLKDPEIFQQQLKKISEDQKKILELLKGEDRAQEAAIAAVSGEGLGFNDEDTEDDDEEESGGVGTKHPLSDGQSEWQDDDKTIYSTHVEKVYVSSLCF